MDTSTIGEDLKQIEKSHGVSLNHWIGGIMHITIQTHYYLQYLTMRIIWYMNAPTENSLLALRNGLEYLMHHPREPIMYSRKKLSKPMKFHINVSSNQGMRKSTKIGNATTSSINIVMRIMLEIHIADALSHQHFTSSMMPSFTGVPKNNMRPL